MSYRGFTAILLAATAATCTTQEPTNTTDARNDSAASEAYHYVLGVDPATGKSILGGGHQVVDLSAGKADAIDTANRAAALHPDLAGSDYSVYDPTAISGETSWDVFPSNWFPQSNNGTAWRWQPGSNQDYMNLSDRDRLSPLEKFDMMFHPGELRSVPAVQHCEYSDYVKNGDSCQKIERPALTVAGPATQWELQNQGNYQEFDPEYWWGHCNGWASYATAEPLGFPKRDVSVRVNASGVVQECQTPAADCMLFRMADIEALMTELYFSDKATFSGRRCNKRPEDIERDEYGRPTDPACRDLNAGTLHIAMTGLLSKGARNLVTGEQNSRPAFVIDHNHDFEVWNFPLVKFEVRSQQTINRTQANELVGANGSNYLFNSQAQKFVEMRSSYWMVSDGVSQSELMTRADQRTVPLTKVDLNYVLELDASNRIIGGEWIQDPQAQWGENSKKLHPDFAWMALDPIGWGENADDTGGNSDNPFVSYPSVRAILACANDPSTCGGAVEPGAICQGHCDEGPFSEAGTNCYCDEGCSGFGDCCSDYVTACAGNPPPPVSSSICENLCGQGPFSEEGGDNCYCDTACVNAGDCCPGYDLACQ